MSRQRVVKVKFLKRWTPADIELALESGFGGVGVVYRGQEEDVLFVEPSEEGYKLLKAQLATMEREGDISYSEQD